LVTILLSAFSGLLLSFAYEPMGKWWIAPIAIAVHMYAINRSNHKILSAFLFAAVANAIALHWSSTFVGSVPWIILAMGLSIFYLPLALVSRWGITTYPLIFLFMEEIRNHFPFGGFGWLRLAYTQPDAPYAQLAAVGGSVALSAVVLLVGLFLFFTTQQKYSLIPIIPIVLILIPIQLQVVGTTTALMIQGNVPEYGLDFNSRAKAVFNNHFQLTQEEIKKNRNVDFILWPENAVDVDPFSDQNRDVFDKLNSIEQPLIIGAVLGKGNKLLNTSIYWDKDQPQIYIKQHLTPFGEYVPLRSLARFVSPLVDRVKDFEPGDGLNSTFSINDAIIAPVICFELIDDGILHNTAKTSNLLAVQTNSATFGMSAESAQQLSITRVRAIEHGRNIVSVSTTGYSAVIDYKGKVLQKTSMGTAESIRTDVELMAGKTPRDKFGTWALIGTFFVVFLVARRAYR
jgi:apolipoprotein N-acyltransferase